MILHRKAFIDRLLAAYDYSICSIQYPMKVKCPSLKSMTDFIQVEWPELKVTLTRTSQTKDRKLSGVRNRYDGWWLVVHAPGASVDEINHNSTDTYRKNWEVARWILLKLQSP